MTLSQPYCICLRWTQNGEPAAADFTIGSGITALIGPSGAGKTTVARLLAGLQAPDVGTISCSDTLLYDTEKGINVPTAQRHIGYVTQDPSLFPTLSVEENILIASALDTAAYETLCAEADVTDLLPRNPQTLSGGEARRVAIVRALAAKPKLLILDEPMTGLDPKRRKSLLLLIRKLSIKTNTPTLLITHHIEEMLLAADHAVLMAKGQTLATGSIEDVIANPQTSAHLGIDDAGSIITATIISRSDGLLCADIGGQTIYLADDDEPIGSRLRLRILGRDISIAKGNIKNISIINQLPAIVQAIDSQGHEQILTLELCDTPHKLLARITEKSSIALRITEGIQVHALVKAVAVKELMTD
ncbi:MAG: ATP-binding cassette domain-containing protein [Kordiimonadaceae bacterium]|nr:ATP-binding cassette domain-containing protein [Kordiimonadaceae bacterium]